MGLNVVSMFDGISCGYVALQRAGKRIDSYIAYEIEPNAIAISRKNCSGIIHRGDVEQADFKQYAGKCDLLIGGSPCQGFSSAGKQLNFADPRSRLFFEFVRALQEIKPKYFLLENVKMRKEWIDIINQKLGGVKPIEINSSLVSAQNRARLYWTNIPINGLPEDKGIVLEDILRTEDESRYPLSVRHHQAFLKSYNWKDSPRDGKAKTLLASYHKQPPHCPYVKCDYAESGFRRLSPVECERLQTLPDGYTEGVADMHRYRALGNAWTVDVIAWIFKEI